MRENEGIAAQILLEFDADAEKVRDEIIRMLSGPGRRQPGQLRPLATPIREPGEDTATRSVLEALLDLVRSAHRTAVDRQNVQRAEVLLAILASLEQVASQLEAVPALREGDDPAGSDRGSSRLRRASVRPADGVAAEERRQVRVGEQVGRGRVPPGGYRLPHHIRRDARSDHGGAELLADTGCPPWATNP